MKRRSGTQVTIIAEPPTQKIKKCKEVQEMFVGIDL